MFTLRMAAILAALAPIGVLAGTDEAAAVDQSTDLDQVVITATRTEQPLDKTGSSVAVISDAQLETRQLLMVSDALAQTPGVTTARTGGVGQVTSLYIRGAEPGESVVLIDGVRINDPSTPDGEPVLGDLLVNDIQRIEILRGPQSTLYGSDAIGGVVNIITQRGGAPSERLDAEGGSFGSYRFNAAANGTGGPVEYGAAANYFDTQGISAVAIAPGDNGHSPYDNFEATANLRYHATDALSFDVRGFYLQSRVGIADYPPPDYLLADTPEFGRDALAAGYAGLNLSLLDGRLTQRIALIGSDSDRRFYGAYSPDPSNAAVYLFTPGENFYADGGATRWEYQGVLQANAANQLTYGAETQLSTIATDTLPDPTDTPTTGRDRLTGYYAQWQSTLARELTLTGGARYDHDDEFGGHTSLKAAGAWQPLDSGTVLRANVGGGFKSPTLYQLYSAYSNPLAPLRPETATGWEAGVDQSLLARTMLATVVYFDRHERNAIEYDDCSIATDPGCAARPLGYYYNIDRTRAHGVEAALTAQPLPTLSAWINYTDMTAIDELTSLPLLHRPHNAGNAGVTWAPRAGTSLGASVGFLGTRLDEDPNTGVTEPLGSATVVNLFANCALTRSVQLYARLDNAFDSRSEPTEGYSAMPLAVYAGVRATL
jgi:vitamin B12 transporter